MAECWRCPYTTRTKRVYGYTCSCNLEPTNMDVTYYCRDSHRDEVNNLCPFENKNTRFPGVDYKKYETEYLTVKEKNNG